jgi:hypothetical protein
LLTPLDIQRKATQQTRPNNPAINARKLRQAQGGCAYVGDSREQLGAAEAQQRVYRVSGYCAAVAEYSLGAKKDVRPMEQELMRRYELVPAMPT